MSSILSQLRSKFTPRIAAILFSVLLCLVVSIAIFTRFHAIWDRTQWFDDSARDVLIAKKISESRTFVPISPKANMGQGYLKNSYLYYNWLGFLWTIGGNEITMLHIFTAINVLSLFFGYQIGKDIGGKWLGLLCLLALSLSSSLAQHNISIYQRSYLPTLSLLIVMLGIKVIKNSSLKVLLLFHIVFTIGVLFHYSIATFAPVVAIISVLQFISNRQRAVTKIAVFISSIIINVSLYLLLTGSNIGEISTFFHQIRQNYYLGSELLSYSNIFNTFNYVYPDTDFLNFTAFEGFLLCCFGASIYIFRKAIKQTGLSIFLLFLLSFAITPLLTGHIILVDYMRHYAVLGIINIPILGFMLVRKYQRKYIPLFIPIFIVIAVYVQLPTLQRAHNPILFLRDAPTTKQILDETVNNYIASTNDNSLREFIIVDYASWEDSPWFTPAFLFFLEKRTGRSYATLSNLNNNLKYTYNRDFKYLYLVCKDWNRAGMGAEYMKKDCLTPFLESNIQNIVAVDRDKISTELLILPEQNSLQITVFKIWQNSNPDSQSISASNN